MTTDKLLIKRVFDTQTCTYRNIDFYLSKTEEELFRLRREIELNLEETPIIECVNCHKAVKLRGGDSAEAKIQTAVKRHQQLHFRHAREKDAKKCPLYPGKPLRSQKEIEREYSKESYAHKFAKNLLATNLQKNPNCSEVRVERRITDESTGDFRQPDVYAVWQGRKIVFEVQLSTTFLHVIVKREQFYSQRNIYVIWVFLSFEPEKFTTKDILYNHKNQVLVLNRKKSRDETVFNVHYLKPNLKGTAIREGWIESEIRIEDLKFDEVEKQAYYFDYQSDFKFAQKAFQKQSEIKRKELIEILKNQIITLLLEFVIFQRNYSSLAFWLARRFKSINPRINLYELVNEIESLWDISRLVGTAVTRKPFGYGFNNIKQNYSLYYDRNHPTLVCSFSALLYAQGEWKKFIATSQKARRDHSSIDRKKKLKFSHIVNQVDFYIPGFKAWFSTPSQNTPPAKQMRAFEEKIRKIHQTKKENEIAYEFEAEKVVDLLNVLYKAEPPGYFGSSIPDTIVHENFEGAFDLCIIGFKQLENPYEYVLDIDQLLENDELNLEYGYMIPNELKDTIISAKFGKYSPIPLTSWRNMPFHYDSVRIGLTKFFRSIDVEVYPKAFYEE